MKKIIVANWKMNPQTIEEAKSIFTGTKKAASKLSKVETVVCPPFVFLSAFKSTALVPKLGAQDAFWVNPQEGRGSYTGEISPDMLKMVGAKYVIIGHSERRENLGETNEMINKKIKAAFEAGLKVIFCVGEKERDAEHEYLRFIKTELEEGLRGIKKPNFKNLVIAYEPIWAIGKKGSEADTPENVLQMSIYIRRVIQPIVGKDLTHDMPILYGGSVDNKNAEGYLKHSGTQGLLVGRSSLSPKIFGEILKIANES